MKPPKNTITNTICQHYRLLSLTFKGRKTVDFSASVVLILPTSLFTASIFLQGNDGLCSQIPLADIGERGEVAQLTYRLTAWSDDECMSEDYRHKIDHKLMLGSVGLARPGKIALFEIDSLNAVLRTKAFSGAKCIQFIC